ncbi:MAG: ATP-binding protein [Streptosporangiaceae bacterium]
MKGGSRSRWAARPWRALFHGSLTARLIASLVALVIVTCAVVGAATYTVLRHSLMANFDQALQAATQRQYQACAADNDDQWYPPPQGHTSSYTDDDPGSSPCDNKVIQGQAAGTFGAWNLDGHIQEAAIVNGECHVSAADQATLMSLPVAPQPPGQGGGGGGSSSPPPLPTFTRDLPSLGGVYELTAVQQYKGGPVLYTGLPLSSVDKTLRDVAIAEAAVFAAVVLFVAGAGVGLVRLSLRPLRRVATTATMVTELPLDTEVSLPARVPDDDPRTEVGQVGAAFNRMLQHVESALERRAASETRLRRFAADASHELRTPLAAIRGYAELALRQGGPVPEDVTHALRRVESESARMSMLVDELLLLARLDAGRPLEQEPVDLTRLTIEATSDAQVASPSHRWQLELPDEPLMVRGDEFRLRQVLGNLLSNAAKHTAPDTTVTVAVSAARPAADGVPAAPGPRAARPTQARPADAGAAGRRPAGTQPAGTQPAVQLSVTDNGQGIPPDLVPELFERFARGDSSRSRGTGSGAGSTGLGLAIVKAVVIAHHGTVNVTSHPGRTTFTITLPRLAESPGDGFPAVPAADDLGAIEPCADEPGAIEPGADEPAATRPAADEPGAMEPGAIAPAAIELGAIEPGAIEPGADEPGAIDPAAIEPGADEPAAIGPGAAAGSELE